MSKIICPFCNSELSGELFNGIYGCDTGCEYVRVEVECPKCQKVNWDSGTFGYFENDEEKQEYREEFMAELAKELKRLAPERVTEINENPTNNN